MLPGALAAVSDVSFYSQGNLLDLVGKQIKMPVVMQVNLDNTESGVSLFGDLKNLNREPTAQLTYGNKEFTCTPIIDNQTNETTGTQCTINIDIILTKPDVNLTFTLIGNNTSTINYTYTFSIDDTHPEVTAITTEYQVGDKYIVTSGLPTEVYIDLQDTVGTFDLRNIYIIPTSGQKTRVLNCTQDRCTGLFVGVCARDTFVDVSIANPSTDDAGNLLVGVPKNVFKCDAIAPQIKKNNLLENDIQVYFDNTTYPYPKTGDTITLSVMVEEDASGVVASANLSQVTGQVQLQAGDCQQKQAGLYNCTWSLGNILDGDHQIAFYIEDGVGRKLTESGQTLSPLMYNLHVDYFENSGNVTTPQFFRPATGKISADLGYNRIAVDLAIDNGFEYPLFATYSLQTSGYGGSVESLHTSVDPYTCILKQGTDEVSAKTFFSKIEVNDPLLNYDKTNRINFVLSPGADINDLEDEFDILCNLSILVRENDNTVYEEPTHTLLITKMKFRNTALGDEHPGEHFAKEIQLKEERLQGFWKFIGTLNTIGATLSDICNFDKVLGGFGSTMVGMQVSGTALENIAPAAGGMLVKSGMKGQGVQKALNSPILGLGEGSSIKGIMETACQWSACSLKANADKNGNTDDYLFSGSTKVSEVNSFFDTYQNIRVDNPQEDGLRGVRIDATAELFENVNVPNPQQSFIAAVETRCFPAMVYHINQYREIECNALTCMKQQAMLGMDISVCSMTKAQSICTNLVGEAFELPGLRQSKNLMDNANAFTQNILPNTLKFVTNNLICKDVNPDSLAKSADGNALSESDVSLGQKAIIFGCNLPESIGTQLNMQIKTTSSAGQFTYPSGDDVCALALCNEDDPTKCTKSSSWIKNTLGMDIVPGQTIQVKPTIQTYTIADYESLVKNYNKATGDEKTAIMKEMQRVGLVDDKAVADGKLDSVELANINKQLENQKKLAGKDGNSSQLMIDENGEMYLSNVEWGRYYDFMTAREDAKNALDADYSTYPEHERYNNLLQERNEAILKYEQQKAVYDKQDLDYENFLKDPEMKSYVDLLEEYSDLSTRYQTELASGSSTNLGEMKTQLDNLAAATNEQAFKIDFDTREEFSNLENTINDRKEIVDPTKDEKATNELNAAAKAAEDKDSFLYNEVKSNNQRLLDSERNYDAEVENFKKSVETEITNINTALNNPNCDADCQKTYEQNRAKLESTIYNTDDKGNQNLKNPAQMQESIKRYATEQHNLQTSREIYASVEAFTDSVTAILMNTKILKYGVLSNYGRDTAFGKISSWADTNLNSQNWIEGMCSPTTKEISRESGDGGMGGAVQCVSGLCMPVLTQSAEKVKFNDTHTLYTLVYALGPVRKPTATSNTDPIEYNVFLKSKDGLTEKKLFNVTWRELPFGQPETYSASFVGKGDYSEICLRFSQKYPPNERGAKLSYCRPIVDASQGNTYFDTGSPVPADFGDPTLTGGSGNIDPNTLSGDI